MKCPACGFNSFDHLELCKKCGAQLHPDPLFKYAKRRIESKYDADSERNTEKGIDETAEREMLDIPIPKTDDEPSGSEQVELIQNRRNRGLDMETGLGRESFERRGVSKNIKAYASAEAGSVQQGGGISHFEEGQELPGRDESPFMFDEHDEVAGGPDQTEKMEYRGQEPEVFNLAGIGARLAAFILDIVIVSVTAFLSLAAGLYLLNGLNIESPGVQRVVLPLYLALFFLASTYFVFLHGLGGKTVGKMMLGIRLINGEGESIGLWYAFVRWIGYFVSAGFLFLGFLWSLFDAEGQTWHDKIADTYVVKD